MAFPFSFWGPSAHPGGGLPPILRSIGLTSPSLVTSAELKGPGKTIKIRPEIVDLGPKSAPKPDEAKPKMPGAVPASRHKPMPNDFGPVSGCFGHDPKLATCEIAQPNTEPPNVGCITVVALWVAIKLINF